MSLSGYGKNSRANTGRFVAKNPKKYCGNPQNIIFRSSYELLFMKWCDQTVSVLEWGSEEVVVPYISPVDGNFHRYFIDFYIKVKDKEGQIKRYLIEVKPHRFTQPPKPPKRKTPRYWAEVRDWAVNQAKWKAAEEFSREAECKFLLITEHDLGLDVYKKP
jgi:hypothetical protein